MKPGHWQDDAHVPYCYLTGSKFSLFLLYGQRFPRNWPIFIIQCNAYGWNLVTGKSSRSCTDAHFLRRDGGGDQNWADFRCNGFQDIDRFSKLPCLGMKLSLPFGKNSSRCMHTLFLPQGVDIELIFTLWASYIYALSVRGSRNWAHFRPTDSGFRDTWCFSKFSYLGMKLDHWQKLHELHLHSLSTTEGRNSAYFRSMGNSYQHRAIFHLNYAH